MDQGSKGMAPQEELEYLEINLSRMDRGTNPDPVTGNSKNRKLSDFRKYRGEI